MRIAVMTDRLSEQGYRAYARERRIGRPGLSRGTGSAGGFLTSAADAA